MLKGELLMALRENITEAVQRCYIIIAVTNILYLFSETSGLKLVKLGNECLQLYYHSTPPLTCSWDLSDIFRTANEATKKKDFFCCL